LLSNIIDNDSQLQQQMRLMRMLHIVTLLLFVIINYDSQYQ